MPGVGIAVGKLAAFFDQHVGNAVADDHAAERNVARGHGFGEGDEIRLGAEIFTAEPATEPSEAADDFVGNQQDAVLVANALNLRPVRHGRNNYAAGALHRLADECGNVVLADFANFFFQPARGFYAEFIRRQLAAKLVIVRLLDVHNAGNRQAALGMHAGHAAERGAGHGAAVVAILAADNNGSLRLSFQFPIAARHAHDRVVRFRTGIGEGHAIHVRRCDFGDGRGQFRGGNIGGLKETIVEG